jgi:hypothetical protein
MKLLIQLFIFALNFDCLAQTILVPQTDVSESSYLEQCQKPGYVCAHQYLSEQIMTTETPQFNEYIENLDLIVDSSRQSLASDVQKILKTEMLSIEQLKSLILIADKSATIEKNKKTEFIQNKLQNLLDVAENTHESSLETDFYIILKKRFSKKDYLRLLPHLSHIKYFHLTPYSYSENAETAIPLLTGNCDSYQIAPLFTEQFKAKQTLPLFNIECSFSGDVRKSMANIKDLTVEYKKPLIITILAAGALFFLKNYDVEFK